MCTDLRERGHRECGWKPGGSPNGGVGTKESPRRPEEARHRDLTGLAFSWKRSCQTGLSGGIRPHTGSDRARSTEILPWSHTIFSNLKAWLLGTFRGVSKKHMHRYLDEFIYRFNHRWRETELFGFVLRRAVRGEPFPYSRLTAELFG